MNSQFVDLSRDTRTDDMAIHASPATVAALGNPTHGQLRSSIGSLTARLVTDPTMRDDCISLTHGWTDANVCDLTSNDEDIDPLTGMVLQSGLAVDLRPAD